MKREMMISSCCGLAAMLAVPAIACADAASVPDWTYDAITSLADAGYVTLPDGGVQGLSREQMAALTARALKRMDDVNNLQTAQTGTDEDTVIALLARLKERGVIRRFGASVKHQKAGYTHNAMVAWIIDEAHVDEAGRAAAQHVGVSHCYHRPSDAADWPYTLYTMVHGRSQEECAAVIRDLAAIEHMEQHAVLSSLRELKKISMTYF